MPRPPETFPDIDLSAAGISLANEAQPEPLGGGHNSSAWRAGSQVLKVTSKLENIGGATKTREAMIREHGTVEPYIGDYMPETEYFLAREIASEGFRVLTVQEFCKGTSLKDFFAKPDAEVRPFMEFLEQSMKAYKKTGLMPDISCIEEAFWPLRDSNTLIREEEENKPVIVDTTSGKTQRLLGPLWNRFIYTGAVLGYKALERRG